jgi:diguanylate cyclase
MADDQQQPRMVRPFLTMDPVTGLLNAHGWVTFAKRHLKRAVHSQQRLGLILVRVENLAQLTAKKGTDVTEVGLLQIAEALQVAIRPGDLLGRWREADFLVLLPYVDAASMEQIADRLAQGVRRSAVFLKDPAVALAVLTTGASLTVTRGELQELDALIASCERQLQPSINRTVSAG